MALNGESLTASWLFSNEGCTRALAAAFMAAVCAACIKPGGGCEALKPALMKGGGGP